MTEEDCNLSVKLIVEITDVYTKSHFPSLNRFQRKKMELSRLKMISPEAQTIKYADIIDNAGEISESDPHFARQYLKECKNIVSALTEGNPELRLIALELISSQQKKQF